MDYKFIMFVGMIVLMVIVSTLFIGHSIEANSNNKYKEVLFPEVKVKIRKKKLVEKGFNKKENETSLKQRIKLRVDTSKLNEKIKKWYYRGGDYHKGLEDFIFEQAKYTGFAVLLGVLGYIAFGNAIVSVIIALIIFALPAINIYGNIQDRQNEFRRDFPYFLQTLAFVLENGSNMAVAFNETTNKQADGVLKEVMLDVISSQRVNGGDFSYAFNTILDKINMDETREFVEIVQNSLEKGIPVAEIFSTQSEQIARFINGKQKRKIKAVSTKILVPILLALGGIAILFF